jgi:CubicO group peptidase (beta-lactamase class C family)
MRNEVAVAIGLWLSACFCGCTLSPHSQPESISGESPKVAWTSLDGRAFSATSIDETVQLFLHMNRVAGLGLALIQRGKVVYANSYGYRDVAANLPLDNNTVLYGASLTKATFAYFVMQLVDAGKIELDRSIGDYLERPLSEYSAYADLAADPRWRKITARMLFSHTAGFANFRWLEPDHKLRLHWDPGTRYAYSGEGILLLQFVVEEGLKVDVGAQMQLRVFDRFGMARSSLTWRQDLTDVSATTYTIDGAPLPIAHREHVRVAGSMNTTLQDWAAFLAAVVRGDGLSPAVRAEMVRRVVEIDSATQFPTLDAPPTDANRAIRLGYALGWGTFESPFGGVFFKEGHDDGTANYALCVDAQQTCMLMLSNSVRAEGIFKYLIDDLFGPVNAPWIWEGYQPCCGEPPSQDHAAVPSAK